MQEFKGWEFCDWESFPKTSSGHGALVRQLKKIVRSKYGLKIVKFDRKEACIAERHGRSPHHYTPHKPDLIITNGENPEDRIFIEYVNTTGRNLQNFVRDLRGMLALSTIIKSSKGFILAIRHSIYQKKCWSTVLPIDSPVEPMSLKSLLFALDKKDLHYLVGQNRERANNVEKIKLITLNRFEVEKYR